MPIRPTSEQKMPTWDLESLLALVRTVCIELQRRKFSNSELYVQVQLIGAQSFQGGPEPESCS